MNVKSTQKKSLSKTNLKKLQQMSDKDLDYSDSPATDESFWDDAEVVMPHHKIHLSVRFDEDIIEFFKKGGRGYQSRMNAVLRVYVQKHQRKRA